MPLTSKQREAAQAVKNHTNILLYGGSGSGKTHFAVTLASLVCSTTDARALIARRYATDVRASVWNITIPKVLRDLGFVLGQDYKTNEQQMTVTFNTGGTIVLAGLDDKERVDKILGQEYAMIYINECQDVPWPTVNILKTRLRQIVDGLSNRFIADLNPTTDAHWSYKLWHLGIHPETKKPLPHPEDYGYVQMNPGDNAENLPASYIEELSNLVGNSRARFYEGNFQNTTGLRVFSPKSLYHWPEFIEWAQSRQGSLKFAAGLDFGWNDADALAILAFVPNERDVWLIYEHKKRRETLEELVATVRDGLAWVRANVPARDYSLKIYTETATLRYGHEGDNKKTASMLAEVYGLPVVPAYKREKKMGIELLQDEVNAGFFHVPHGGPFHDETEQTIWTRESDGTIVRIIDDEAYHPDEMDAILYPSREIYSYSGEEHKQLPEPPPGPPEPTVNQRILDEVLESINSGSDVW